MLNNNNINNSSSGGGIGFAGLLTIVFIILKLIGVINWSWLWVLSPLLISFGFVAIFIIFILIVSFIAMVFKDIK